MARGSQRSSLLTGTLLFLLVVCGPSVAETIVPPEEVEQLTVAISGSDIVLNWDPVAVDMVGLPKTVGNYRVYLGALPSFVPDRSGGTNRIGEPTLTTFTHVGVVGDGQDAYYLVSAVDTAGVEGNTQPSSINSPGIEVLAHDTGNAMLEWIGSFPDTLVSGYRVYRAVTSLDYQDVDTFGDVTSALIALPGLNQVYYLTVFGADLDGNLTPFIQEVELELVGGSTPPNISATIDPPVGVQGWFNTPITVTFDCAPAVPGVICPPPLVLDTDGANQLIVGTVDDGMGNTATVRLTADIDQSVVEFTPVLSPPSNALNWNNTDVTLSFICNDATSGVTRCPDPRLIDTEGANQLVFGPTADVAGNPFEAYTFVSIDKTPPAVTAQVTPPANASGWHAVDVSVAWTCSDGLSGVDSCPTPAAVTDEGAGQIVGAQVNDLADNATDGTVVINLDRSPPEDVQTAPASGARVATPNVTLMGTVQELSGLAGVTCAGQPGTVGAASFSCDLTLVAGDNPIQIDLVDLAGNNVSHMITLRQTSVFLPTITIDSPTPETVTQASQVTVSGTTTEAVAVTVNGIAAALNGGVFSADVPIGEGVTAIVATAENSDGETASATLSVRRDTESPVVVIESPLDGDATASSTVAVAGTVNDIIPGATVNDDDVVVTVNGQPALVNNRTFFLDSIPLVVGSNVIQVDAVDSAGNMGSSQISVERLASTFGIRVIGVQGDSQSQPVFSTLPTPLTVRVESSGGSPMVNRAVTFEVSRGDGLLGKTADGFQRRTVLTDSAGEASIDFTLGSRTGMGFHRVRASTPGSLTTVVFCATGTGTAPATISPVLPLPAQGAVGEALPRPLRVMVSDTGGNTVRDVPVTFTVVAGGGSVAGGASTVVMTNADGMAQTTFTLGTELGLANHVVEATYPGSTGLPASFTVSGVGLGPVASTTVQGTVQDSAAKPIVGARAFINGTALEAFTGTDGKFVIANVPPAGHIITIEGSTASDPPNDIYFPDIAFAIEVLPGVVNNLDQPVMLPFLDMAGAQMVGGASDVILEMADVPGFAIKIFANSVILPDGQPGQISMSSSQVKFDKVPMPPPQGSTPIIVGTLQPGGVLFDPPAQVIYPNAEGLAPGDVADIFAFHHDIGEFVNLGPGTVSSDGSVVTSDPGFGIVESGWHCLLRIPGPAGDCEDCRITANGPDKICQGQSPTYTAGPGSNISWDADGAGPTNPSGSGPTFMPGPFTGEGGALMSATRLCEDGGTATDFVFTQVTADGMIFTDPTPRNFFVPAMDLVIVNVPKVDVQWNRVCMEQEKCCPLTGETACKIDCAGDAMGQGPGTTQSVPGVGNLVGLFNRVVCKRLSRLFRLDEDDLGCEVGLMIGFDNWILSNANLGYFRNDCTDELIWMGTGNLNATNVNLTGSASITIADRTLGATLSGSADLKADFVVQGAFGLALPMPENLAITATLDEPFLGLMPSLTIPIPDFFNRVVPPMPFTLPTSLVPDCELSASPAHKGRTAHPKRQKQF